MKNILNTFALLLAFITYPLSFIFLKTNVPTNLSLQSFTFNFLFYSYYLVTSWDYFTVMLLFIAGIILGLTSHPNSVLKLGAFYYFLITSFAVLFYTLFQNGFQTLTTFSGRLYVLGFYVVILKAMIFSFIGAILSKKLKLSTKLNKKSQDAYKKSVQTICPHCGTTFKSNPIICTYCGQIIDIERYNVLKLDVNDY